MGRLKRESIGHLYHLDATPENIDSLTSVWRAYQSSHPGEKVVMTLLHEDDLFDLTGKSNWTAYFTKNVLVEDEPEQNDIEAGEDTYEKGLEDVEKEFGFPVAGMAREGLRQHGLLK